MATDIGGLSQLVQYSDSSGDENIETEVCEKPLNKRGNTQMRNNTISDKSPVTSRKRCRLEMPPSMLAMFSEGKKEIHEDPSQHQGRIRTFAHERGNWATFVYFPVKMDTPMRNLVDNIVDVLPTSPSGWTQMPTVHLSLSRTVAVLHHWIEDLMAALGSVLRTRVPFDCSLGSVVVYTNDEKTRTFIGLRVANGQKMLSHIVGMVDSCFEEYKLQEYYKNPSFHVSIAWTLGDLSAAFTDEQKEALHLMLTNHILLRPTLAVIDTNAAEAKCGNRIFSFPLLGS